MSKQDKNKINKKTIKQINPTTIVTNHEIANQIRKSARKKPSKKARQINKNALKLLRQIRE